MNKIVQHLFLFEKFEIQTKLSKKEILKKINSFADPEYTDYYGSVSENEFFIAEKNRKLKHSVFLSNPQAWHIISPCGAGYHHA